MNSNISLNGMEQSMANLGHPHPCAAAALIWSVKQIRRAEKRAKELREDIDRGPVRSPLAPGMVFRTSTHITATVVSAADRIVWDKFGRPSWHVMATVRGATPADPVPFDLVDGFFSIEPQTPGV